MSEENGRTTTQQAGHATRHPEGTMNDAQRKRLIAVFNDIHAAIGEIREIGLGGLEDEACEDRALVTEMEDGCFAPMRKLRFLWDIPYKWGEPLT